MDTNTRKLYETQRAGLLKQVDGFEIFLGVNRTAVVRKRCKELQMQMDRVKAWAKTRGLVIPK